MSGVVGAPLPLPHTPVPFQGELLSSWLKRIAAEYRTDLASLCLHLKLSTSSQQTIDYRIKEFDVRRIAAAMHMSYADVRQMAHQPLRSVAKALVATGAPIQHCRSCRARHSELTTELVQIKAWFEFWQFECRYCQTLFASAAGPVLSRSNPAREAPIWFNQILPYARVGRKHLSDFARRPLGVMLTPTSVLNLLSMRLNVNRNAPAPRGQKWGRNWIKPNYILELFLPGLCEEEHFFPLIAESWRIQKPVRRVTDRTILLAALAEFLVDPTASFNLIINTADASTRACIDRWMTGLPNYSRNLLMRQV